MPTLYWSIVSLILGGCIGSFLNVVIYRWPRGISIRRPARSFCPNCEKTIAWYDNIPVLSYLVLRGRCRKCGIRISPQYPLVELATALLFLMTYDAFFVADMRVGVTNLSSDWPILVAHWVLWSGMIALSVMDLEAYMVDINVTWIVSAAGLLFHTLWTPVNSAVWIRPGPEGAVLAVGAAVGLLIGVLLFLRQPAEGEIAEPEPELPAQVPGSNRFAPWLLLPIGLVAGYLAVQQLFPDQTVNVNAPHLEISAGWHVAWVQGAISSGALRLIGGLAALFVGLAAVASLPHQEADKEIVEAIMDEAHFARRTALFEIKLLAPAVLLGVGGLYVLIHQPAAYGAASQVLHWSPVGDWQPLWGLATGLAGWVIGGAVGWLTRIFFTLVFGKEALGMGDVHILAAAGAVAGWPVAFLGFFLAAPLALLALVVIRLRRQSRMLPYGPWLALAFLVASIFQDRILQYLGIREML